MSRQLTQIKCDVPLSAGDVDLRRQAPDMEALGRCFDRADFGPMLRRQAERIAQHM